MKSFAEGGPYEVDLADHCLNQAPEQCPVQGEQHQCGRECEHEEGPEYVEMRDTHRCHYCGHEWEGGTALCDRKIEG